MAYFDKYGVEFSDDRKTLVRCPKDFKGEYTVPNEVIIIGARAFSGCAYITSVVIPNGVAEIDIYAFKDCQLLSSVDIPDSVNKIGGCAFENCMSLASIKLPNNITSIGTRTFANCKKIESVILPTSLAIIREIYIAVHYDCRRLRHDAEPVCNDIKAY